MRHLKRIDDVLALVEQILVVTLFTGLLTLMLLNILSRNLWGVSFQKALEVTPMIVLWMTLLGASLALKRRRHIKLELFVSRLPSHLQQLSRFLTAVFGLAVMGVLLWASWGFVLNEVRIFGSWGWGTAIFPLFFMLGAFRYLVLAIAPVGQWR